MTPERQASRLPWPAFSGIAGERPVLLAVGSFEQHGPHLPMATDAIVAGHLIADLAERVDGLALPVIPFGAPSRPRSGGGDGFPAPALRLGTLLDAVEQVTRGLVDAGARRIVVTSWHFENAAVLWDALRPAVTGTEAVVLLFESPWDYLTEELVRDLFPGEPDWPADHAGRLETAVMRHLEPGLVGDPPAPVEYDRRSFYDVLPTPVDAVPHTGVALDARDVTAEQGRRCFEAMIAGMAEAITRELGLGQDVRS
jgi:creatinine amidohydrolase